jgi:hypothetical protein
VPNRHFAFKRRQFAEITYEEIERKLGNIKAPAERNHAMVAVKVFLEWLPEASTTLYRAQSLRRYGAHETQKKEAHRGRTMW